MGNFDLRKLFPILCFVFLGLIEISYAEVPYLINYQGTLSDTEGIPVPDGNYNLVFSIYEKSTEGEPIWVESWDLKTSPVTTLGGKFNVMLGSHKPFLPRFFSEHPITYLAIKVGNDSEMIPRQRITSTAYAFNAGNGIPIGGIIMWSGTVDNIPDGWALCDGMNGTPDLRDRFILGAGGSLPIAGGAISHSHTAPVHRHKIASNDLNHYHDVQGHTHSFTGSTGKEIKIEESTIGGAENYEVSDHTHLFSGITESNPSQHTSNSNEQGFDLNHDHGGETGFSEPSQVSENTHLPPYFSLAFIMKL